MAGIDTHVAGILTGLGYDLGGAHLVESPGRIARFMQEWHTLDKPAPKLTTFANPGYDEVVAVGGIWFYSLCAHHGLPFFGHAAVGYLPNGRVVGLSKLARTVDHFARRFQVQEALTSEIADYLQEGIKPKGLGVVLRAEHLCMSMRGIQRPGHKTLTSVMRGAFLDSQAARAELLALLEQ